MRPQCYRDHLLNWDDLHLDDLQGHPRQSRRLHQDRHLPQLDDHREERNHQDLQDDHREERNHQDLQDDHQDECQDRLGVDQDPHPDVQPDAEHQVLLRDADRHHPVKKDYCLGEDRQDVD
jgi:hypothetical protein